MAALTIEIENTTTTPLVLATNTLPREPLDPGYSLSFTIEADDFDTVRVRIESPASLPLVDNPPAAPPAEPETPEEEKAA